LCVWADIILRRYSYCKDAIRHLLLGAVGFANWMQVAGGDLTSLHEGVWNTFCDHLAKQGRLHGTKGQHSIYWRGAKQFTEFLRAQQGIVATKAALAPPELVAAFEHWMQIHRGVKPSTLITYRQHVLAAVYIRRNLAALNGGGIWRRRERCDVNETGARRAPES
jgi:hypothetical protein